MVEASIVVTLVVIFISVLFYIGMILYQHSAQSTMANQTATNIAQVYGNTIRDPFTGYIDSDSIYQNITYSSIRDEAENEIMLKKANYLAKFNMKRSRIISADTSDVDVQIVKKPNELLKNQVIVTVTDRYDVPLVGIFGVDNSLEFKSTGRADCVDLLEYLNGVQAVGDPEASSSYNITDSDTVLVTFHESTFNDRVVAVVPVYRNMSISSSNKYIHSTVPDGAPSEEFTFNSWRTVDGETFTSQTVVADNLDVYGCYQCVVTLDAQGGEVEPNFVNAIVGESVELPTPTRQCYLFKGWYDQTNGSGEFYDSTTIINDNITLYANWTENHNYKNYKVENGTCVTRGKIYQRCTGCGKERVIDGNYGGHNMKLVSTEDPRGVACNQRVKSTYRCANGCGKESSALGGYGQRHTFFTDDPQKSNRCNRTHSTNVFHCETTNGRDCGARTMYEVCCARCGKVNNGTYTTKDGRVVKKGYWCGKHGTWAGVSKVH